MCGTGGKERYEAFPGVDLDSSLSRHVEGSATALPVGYCFRSVDVSSLTARNEFLFEQKMPIDPFLAFELVIPLHDPFRKLVKMPPTACFKYVRRASVELTRPTTVLEEPGANMTTQRRHLSLIQEADDMVTFERRAIALATACSATRYFR